MFGISTLLVCTLIYIIKVSGQTHQYFLQLINYKIIFYESYYVSACSTEQCDKNVHLLGFVPHTLFCLLDLFTKILPRLEIIFCINHYFLVCILKYRTSTRVNHGLEI